MRCACVDPRPPPAANRATFVLPRQGACPRRASGQDAAERAPPRSGAPAARKFKSTVKHDTLTSAAAWLEEARTTCSQVCPCRSRQSTPSRRHLLRGSRMERRSAARGCGGAVACLRFSGERATNPPSHPVDPCALHPSISGVVTRRLMLFSALFSSCLQCTI